MSSCPRLLSELLPFSTIIRTLLNPGVFTALTLGIPSDTLLQMQFHVGATARERWGQQMLGSLKTSTACTKPVGRRGRWGLDHLSLCGFRPARSPLYLARSLGGKRYFHPPQLTLEYETHLILRKITRADLLHLSFSKPPSSVVLNFGCTLEIAGELLEQLMPGFHPQGLLPNWLSSSWGIGMLMCRVKVGNC